MNRKKTEAIVDRLMTNSTGLRYGTVSVAVKLHDGRVVQVLYSTTENTKETSLQVENEKSDYTPNEHQREI